MFTQKSGVGAYLLTNLKFKTHKNVTRVQVIDKIIRISQIRANLTISNMVAG